MILLRVARPMLAAIFVFSAADALRDPKPKVELGGQLLDEVRARTGGWPSVDAETAVRVDALVKLGAGTMLAFGRLPRLSALVLAASLVPTTLAGHRYRIHQDRIHQRIQLLKNVAIMGGLVVAAGARPTGRHGEE